MKLNIFNVENKKKSHQKGMYIHSMYFTIM